MSVTASRHVILNLWPGPVIQNLRSQLRWIHRNVMHSWEWLTSGRCLLTFTVTGIQPLWKKMLAALIKNHGKLWHSCTSVGAFQQVPNLRGLFWTSHWTPRPPYPCVSLCLHLTNCALSHNTLSAFNYCLEVSGLRVAFHWESVCICVCAWVARPERVLCMTVGALREVLNSTALLPPCSLLITHPGPVATLLHIGLVLRVQIVC